MTEPFLCPRCNGIKQVKDLEGFPPRACYTCEGQGELPPVDEMFIRERLFSKKGLRSTKPKNDDSLPPAKRIQLRRAQYVWRMARFHGGKDTTLPIMATIFVRNDPARPMLDELADTIAREAFGSDLRAARTWGKALGYLP